MNQKGQGTTEYLIILAIIIVIALVVVGVIGGFPSFSSGITESQSKSYWTTTTPFSIHDWTVSSSQVSIVVENLSQDNILLREIRMNGQALGLTDVNIFPGERYTTPAVGFVTCTSGELYTYDIEMTYNTPYMNNRRQIGIKPLVGKCP